MDREEMRRAILAGIQLPVIPDYCASAVCFGVRTDAVAIQTEAIQRGIDELASRGGGRLELPAGIYRTGALHLKSGVELHLGSPDTVIQFVCEDIGDNYPLRFSHWEASPCYNFSALLYACDAENIAVTGHGVLDGGADEGHWWNWHHQVERSWSADKPDLQGADRETLRRMNREGVPVEERIFGEGHYLRPNFVQFIRCRRVLLQGVTFRNSPMWQLNPVLCRSVIVDGVTLSSHGANNDGCDPESCDGVWIKNCRFDTGDDCISLKSGRDRDGREANVPCENVLIEANEFADGHGGVALGSEMSGGIRSVLACFNRFSSPNLTYALRLKTNARRGGRIERIMLCDSVMENVHGAAVHGTMLYEDGRNGDSLPVFRDITVENLKAHGGDYGIFLEAFPEVPITGLVLRNLEIDGVERELRSMNWQGAVVENVRINGKRYPRPGYVRILGVPAPGAQVRAGARGCGADIRCFYTWELSRDGSGWREAAEGERFTVPEGAERIRVMAQDAAGNREYSREYLVSAAPVAPDTLAWECARLACREMADYAIPDDAEKPATRRRVARMLAPLGEEKKCGPIPADTREREICLAVANEFFALDEEGNFHPDRSVSRQEMATVCMQACGVNYRNASSTMPVCADADRVGSNYGTNVARALYFGFMSLERNCFRPERPVTVAEAVVILNRVADFAGV